MRISWLAFATLAGALGCASMSAQRTQEVGYGGVSPADYPPAGMCRVWLEGLPRDRQPGATDCETARRAAAGRVRVLYGDEAPGRGEAGGGDYGLPAPSGGDYGGYSPRYGAMPSMQSAVAFERNHEVNDEVRRWVPPVASKVRLVTVPGSNQLLKAIWLDRDDRTVQVWIDTDNDGYADQIERYVNGEKVETIGRSP